MRRTMRAGVAGVAGLVALAAACDGGGPAPVLVGDAGPPAAGGVAFVQLFEWKWTDIARECEAYLGPRGFTGVQISPPNEHAWIGSGDGAPFPWWMRYQPVSYSLERSRSGTRAELADMIARCRAAGVAIYADAVINHMAAGAGTTSSEGEHPWGTKRFPGVPYGVSDFHPTCPISNYYSATNVQRCELVGLADLDTGKGYVRGKITDYLAELASLGVAGFRIDAAKHISAADLGAIVDAAAARAAAPPFWFLEVIGAPGEAVQPADYSDIGGGLATITEFGYGAALYRAFAGAGRPADLRALGEAPALLPSSRAVPFTDNHDKQRGHAGGGGYLTYHDGALYELANVFMLAWPYGYPVVMSSYAFETASAFDTSYGPPADPATGATRGPWDGGGDAPACGGEARGGWVCEHRRRAIGNMVGFRGATMADWRVTDWWDDGDGGGGGGGGGGGRQIAFGRGGSGFVVINAEAAPLQRTFQTSLPAGRYCDVLSGDFTPAPGGGGGGTCTGAVITVDAGGAASIAVAGPGAAAIHAGARLGP